MARIDAALKTLEHDSKNDNELLVEVLNAAQDGYVVKSAVIRQAIGEDKYQEYVAHASSLRSVERSITDERTERAGKLASLLRSYAVNDRDTTLEKINEILEQLSEAEIAAVDTSIISWHEGLKCRQLDVVAWAARGKNNIFKEKPNALEIKITALLDVLEHDDSAATTVDVIDTDELKRKRLRFNLELKRKLDALRKT